MPFVDLTKAFDTVCRDGLKATFGCPFRFIAMVRQFYDCMQARVQNDGEFFKPFEVTKWVCYGTNTVQHEVVCIVVDALQDNDTGFPIRHHFDGSLFNLRMLQAKP